MPASATPPDVMSREQAYLARRANLELNCFESLSGQPVALSRPLRLCFDVSSVCNCSCIFCLAKEARKKPSDQDAFRPASWMDQLTHLLPFIEKGVFCDFESLLNPEFNAMAETLRQYHTPFEVRTNGMALTPETSAFLLRNGLVRLVCSVHGARKDTAESIMRGSDFGQIVANLQAFSRLRDRISPQTELTLTFIAMRRNVEQLPEYVKMARRLGAQSVAVHYMMVTRPGTGLEEESVYFHQELYDRCLSQARRVARTLGMKLGSPPLFGRYAPGAVKTACYNPWQMLYMGRTGAVAVCCNGGNEIVGNVFEEDFFKVWNSKKMQAFRRAVNSPNPPAVCRRCTEAQGSPHDIRKHLSYLLGTGPEELVEHIKPWEHLLPEGFDPDSGATLAACGTCGA